MKWALSISSFLLLIAGSLHPAFSADGQDAGKFNWLFRISAVERAVPTREELHREPKIAAKWVVTTELANNTRKTKYILTVPYYGASTRKQLETKIFTGGSRLPLTNKARDCLRIDPSAKASAKHVIFAKPAPSHGKFIIFGWFTKNVDVPKHLGCNNFPREWSLDDSPVGERFRLSMTLFDWCPPYMNTILGDELNMLWKGQLITEPVYLKVHDDK
jgi:hypothetical protein